MNINGTDYKAGDTITIKDPVHLDISIAQTFMRDRWPLDYNEDTGIYTAKLGDAWYPARDDEAEHGSSCGNVLIECADGISYWRIVYDKYVVNSSSDQVPVAAVETEVKQAQTATRTGRGRPRGNG